MNCAVEMGPDAILCISSCIKSGSGIQKLMEGSCNDTQHGHFLRLEGKGCLCNSAWRPIGF
jgi:hypothetical protein